jgi:hypothetical protein
MKNGGSQTIDAATLRRLSVRASCDPRSVKRVLEGHTVRGLAFHRIRQVLEEAGIVPAMTVPSTRHYHLA